MGGWYVKERKIKRNSLHILSLAMENLCDDSFYVQITYSQKSPEIPSHQVPDDVLIAEGSFQSWLQTLVSALGGLEKTACLR